MIMSVHYYSEETELVHRACQGKTSGSGLAAIECIHHVNLLVWLLITLDYLVDLK